MGDPILTLSDRGQLTIPKAFRKKIPGKHFTGTIEKGRIILNPLQTREEFIQELEEAEKDWDKNGGVPWDVVMKKAGL